MAKTPPIAPERLWSIEVIVWRIRICGRTKTKKLRIKGVVYKRAGLISDDKWSNISEKRGLRLNFPLYIKVAIPTPTAECTRMLPSFMKVVGTLNAKRHNGENNPICRPYETALTRQARKELPMLCKK